MDTFIYTYIHAHFYKVPEHTWACDWLVKQHRFCNLVVKLTFFSKGALSFVQTHISHFFVSLSIYIYIHIPGTCMCR